MIKDTFGYDVAGMVASLEDSLKHFPLYSGDHIVGGKASNGFLRLWYYAADRADTNVTRCGLYLTDGVNLGVITNFFVDSRNGRRLGHGRRMYSALEYFFMKQSCQRIELRSSIDGLPFWPEMGFRPVQDFAECSEYKFEKVLPTPISLNSY